MDRRWTRTERAARIANGFERERRSAAPMTGMAVHVSEMQSPGFHGGHLQEAFEMGRRQGRYERVAG